MAESLPYAVTRRPGAPEYRAGRRWPAGETVTCELAAEDAALIAADPGYTLRPVGTNDVPLSACLSGRQAQAGTLPAAPKAAVARARGARHERA